MDAAAAPGCDVPRRTPFNAEAVKYNIERIIDPANAVTFAFLLNAVSEVRVVDEYTVQLVTDEPFAPMINHLTHSATGMQSPTAMQLYGDDYGLNPGRHRPVRV